MVKKFPFFRSDTPKTLVISHPQPALPPKGPVSAKTPPLLVIRALHDSPGSGNPDFPSFVKGEFLHVLSIHDNQFYQARDPVQNKIGLFPISYFEVIHKNEALAAAMAKDTAPRFPSAGHDSGYAENVHTNHNSEPKGPTSSSSSSYAHPPPRTSQGKSASGSTKCFYGKLLYTFTPERPDELMATEGETVLIVAISNDQWVVAKPIHRLGGPGLLPFNHIQVIDMKTDAVISDPYRTMVESGVPSAEQWKTMASTYKDRSIQLGIIDTSSAPEPPKEVLQRTSGTVSHNGHHSGPHPPSSSSSHHSHHHQSVPSSIHRGHASTHSTASRATTTSGSASIPGGAAGSISGQPSALSLSQSQSQSYGQYQHQPQHQQPPQQQQQHQYQQQSQQPPGPQPRGRTVAVKYRMEGQEGDIYVVRVPSTVTFEEFMDKLGASRQSHITADSVCRTAEFVVTYTDGYARAETAIENHWGLARYLELPERPVLFLRGVSS